MRAAVERLLSVLRPVDADVVLVLADDANYAAAQQVRMAHGTAAWPDLDDDLRRDGLKLADRARAGGLVAFAGAGASIGAGAPSWSQLLTHLNHGPDGPLIAVEDFDSLDNRDQAALIEDAVGRDQLVERIVEATDVPAVSVVHQLLASIGVTEIVTTNYDRGIERAFRGAGKGLAVLPGEGVAPRGRWLLKMHGSVAGPLRDKIVLTRDDYLHFEGTGIALAGVVQAMLLTRHMMFVGYSLSDDNFRRLVHQVRLARGQRPDDAAPEAFGTVVATRSPGTYARLWNDDLEWTGFVSGSDDPRLTTIFLDYVAAHSAAPAAHLLDPAYSVLFSEAEHAVGAAFGQALRAAAADGVRPEIRDAVHDSLRSIGVTMPETDHAASEHPWSARDPRASGALGGGGLDFEHAEDYVRSVPPGRWTTYGDVAAAAGNRRAPVPVGNWLRQRATPLPGIHRVLREGGRVSPNWVARDPSLPQTPTAVERLLVSEGVSFAGGEAEPSRRWRPEDWLGGAGEATRPNSR